MSTDILNQAIALIRSGDRATAQNLLAQLVRQDPNNEAGWMWLSTCLDSADRKKFCLNRVLSINPNNSAARQALARLNAPVPIEHPSVDDIAPTPPKPAPVNPVPPTAEPIDQTAPASPKPELTVTPPASAAPVAKGSAKSSNQKEANGGKRSPSKIILGVTCLALSVLLMSIPPTPGISGFNGCVVAIASAMFGVLFLIYGISGK